MYKYFVSYMHGKGGGNIEICTSQPITDMQEITEIARRIEKAHSIEGAAVMNFILLSGPK